MSKKYPNGDIVSASYFTEMEESDIDPKELFKLVRKSTMEDIKEAIKESELDASIWKSIRKQLKREKKLSKA